MIDPTPEQIEAAASAIYENERSCAALGQHWPSWGDLAAKSDTLEQANASVLWDLEKVNAAGRTRVGPPNGTNAA